ncbi:MAG: hypothetical protein ACHRXM_07470 [Isosphaerales bacterium]
MIESTLMRLRDQEDEDRRTVLTVDDLIDHEFVEFCAREADDTVSLEEVLKATCRIEDSMARVIIEDERADRFCCQTAETRRV